LIMRKDYWRVFEVKAAVLHTEIYIFQRL